MLMVGPVFQDNNGITFLYPLGPVTVFYISWKAERCQN